MIRILHVDDSIQDLEFIKLQLQRISDDLHISRAESSQEALALIADSQFDCILCDYQMHDGDGLELLNTIRAKGNYTPFIFLTGQGSEKVAAEALRAGADDYFTKDEGFAHYERLVHSIKRVVEAHRQRFGNQIAEEKRRQSEARYRAISELTSDFTFYYIFEKEGTIRREWADGAYEKITGYSCDELNESSGWMKVVHPGDHNTINELNELISSGEDVSEEHRIITKSGELRWLSVYARPVRDKSSGKIIGLIGAAKDITEHKLAEQALRKSEEQIRALFQAIPDLVFRIDKDGVFLDYHAGWEAKLLMPPEEFLGRKAEEVLPTDLTDLLMGHLRTVVSTGEPQKFEYKASIGDQELEFEGRMVACGDDEATLVIRDITEISNAVEALRESEFRYRTLTELTSGYTYCFRVQDDGAFELEWASGAITEITGYSKDEFDPKAGWTSLVHPDDRPTIERLIDEHLSGKAAEAELRIVTKGGEVRWVRHCGRPIFDEGNNRIVRIIGATRDITESKIAEEALRRSEEKYRSFFEDSKDGIYISTPEGRIIDINPSGAELFGYSREELMSMNAEELYVNPEDRRGYVRDATNLEHTIDYPCSYRRKDGKVVHALTTSWIRRDKEGKIIGYEGIIHDITERKRAEEELEESRNQLRARTAELEAVNKELEAFSYSVSHDLQAPLRHINGFSEELLSDYSDKLDRQGKVYLDDIVESCRTMSRLIDDLLKLSKMTRGEVKRETVEMSDLANNVVKRLKADEPERKVNIAVEDGVKAEGDLELLMVVLENLIGNAWKFTSKKVPARIEFGAEQKENGQVYFVKDNGIGFDPTNTDKLFAPFTRLHKDSDFKGSGIGLATVKRIIHRHGGKIWAEGRPGKGAVFYFTLG